MGVTTTPLGFQLPDGNDAVRNGDNIIKANGQKADELILEARARLANLQGSVFTSGFDGGTPFSDFSRSFDGGSPATEFTDEETAYDPLDLNDAAVAQALTGGTTTPLALEAALGDTLGTLDDMVAKGALVYNVKDYGATGDGSTDDTTAVRAAITAAPAGSVVYFPQGTYILSGVLTVEKALTLTGPGTLKLTFTAAGLPCIRVTSNAVTVAGLTLEGVGFAGLRVTGSNAIHVVGSTVAYLQDVRILNNTISGFGDSGIWTEYTSHCLIAGNIVRDLLYAGILVVSAWDCIIEHNIISNMVQKAPTVNTYGIAVTDTENSTTHNSKRVAVTGNVVSYVRDWEGIDTHGAEDITISNNVIIGCRDGVAAVGGAAERVPAAKNTVITGNVINATGANSTRSGIRLIGTTTNEATGLIMGNHITGYTTQFETSLIDEDRVYSDLPMVYTPSWTNLTVGNGVLVSRYTRAGKMVTLHLSLTFGTTTTVDAGIIDFTLPVTVDTLRHVAYDAVGSCTLIDSSVGFGGRYGGTAALVSAVSSRITLLFGTTGQVSGSGTEPFVFADGDKITCIVTYEGIMP